MRTTLLAVTAGAVLQGLAPPRARAQDTTAAAAQPASTAISPGMTDAEVRARWGPPDIVRTSGPWTFLFYRNGVERSTGWLDVVFLDRGRVVDCIARGAGHTYTGQSSSPPGRVPAPTLRPQAGDTAHGAVTGVRVNP